MKTDKFDVGDRVKIHEKRFEQLIKYDEYIIIRIDGHKFSKFTKKFKKPFDSLLSTVMEKTMKDVFERFGAITGYQQSDEITLVIKPIFSIDKEEIRNDQIFSGRTQKIASLVSSFTTMRFNYWFRDEFLKLAIDDEYKVNVEKHLDCAWFDARVFGVPTKELACDVIFWRYIDAVRNSKSMFAQAYCSHKSLLNKTSSEQVDFCRDSTGHDWYAVEDRFKYGIFVKKEHYFKSVDLTSLEKFGITIPPFVERSRVISVFKKSFSSSPENIDFVIEKYSKKTKD